MRVFAAVESSVAGGEVKTRIQAVLITLQRRQQGFDRFLVFVQVVVGPALIVGVFPGIPWIEGFCLANETQGLLSPSELIVDEGQQPPPVGIVRGKSDGLIDGFSRLLELLSPHVHVAQGPLHLGRCRFDSHRFFYHIHRFVEENSGGRSREVDLEAPPQGNSQRAVGPGKLGIERDGFAVQRLSLTQALQSQLVVKSNTLEKEVIGFETVCRPSEQVFCLFAYQLDRQRRDDLVPDLVL